MDCLDVWVGEEDKLIVETLRNFVNREIMPVRREIENDKEHKLILKILLGLTKLGLVKAIFPENYSSMKPVDGMTIFLISEEVARGDIGIAVAQAATRWSLGPMIIGKNKELLEEILLIQPLLHLFC